VFAVATAKPGITDLASLAFAALFGFASVLRWRASRR
jgi:hypothetical protein